MKKSFLALILAAASSQASALTTGDIAFTSFNADEDGWSLVTFVDIAANTTIYFSDNEATSLTAFNSGESAFSWNTGASVIDAGTVVRFSAIDGVSRAASVGSFAAVDTSNLGLSASNDTLYAYMGASHTAPNTFLAAVSSEGSTNLTPAGLTSGVNAVVLTNSTDYAEYTGARSGEMAFADYKSMVNNPANWFITTTGDNSGTLPNTAAFTITPVPEAETYAMMLAGLGLVGFMVSRRRKFQ
jgi:hypothetical protein